MISHAFALDWTFLVGLGVFTGLVISIVAHLKHGYITLILLIIHMGIESVEHANQITNYSNWNVIFYGLHTLLDILFLYQEAKAHLFKYRYVFTLGVIVCLCLLFLCLHKNVLGVVDTHQGLPIESVVIGGILGCTFSQILSHTKIKNKLA